MSRPRISKIDSEARNRQRAAGRRSPKAAADDQDLYSGLIRLHILHHAAEGPVYGLWMIQELARHGYRLSAGTLYPVLHGLEERRYLRSVEEREGRRARRLYRITPTGRRALQAAKRKVRELFGEMLDEGKRARS